MEREGHYHEHLLAETRQLLDWIETTTGRRVEIEPDSAIRSRGRALFAVSDPNPARYLIKYDPLHEPTRDALIAHEVGHIAMLSAAGADAPVPVITQTSTRFVLNQLEPELLDLVRRGLPVDAIAEVFPIWMTGTVGQLVDTPADISIEAWLHTQWPGLRDVQNRSLRDQARAYSATLDERVRSLTPPTIWRASVRMNGRLVQTYANLLDDQRLSAPWNRLGLRERGGQPGGLMQLSSAHALTSTWQDEFGLSGWFEWKRLSAVRGETIVTE